MRQYFLSFRGFQIGAHDIRDTTHFGIVPQLAGGDFRFLPGLLKCLQCHINANFISELETIGNGFGDAVNVNRNLVDDVGFNPLAVGLIRVLYSFDGRILDLGWLYASGQGYPLFTRELGGQFMELQRG